MGRVTEEEGRCDVAYTAVRTQLDRTGRQR